MRLFIIFLLIFIDFYLLFFYIIYNILKKYLKDIVGLDIVFGYLRVLVLVYFLVIFKDKVVMILVERFVISIFRV